MNREIIRQALQKAVALNRHGWSSVTQQFNEALLELDSFDAEQCKSCKLIAHNCFTCQNHDATIDNCQIVACGPANNYPDWEAGHHGVVEGTNHDNILITALKEIAYGNLWVGDAQNRTDNVKSYAMSVLRQVGKE